MKLSELNQLDETQLGVTFQRCCSASRWVKLMVSKKPYASRESIEIDAQTFWNSMETKDYMEAFDGHPKIGDPDSLKIKYRNTHTLAANEQSTVEQASDRVLQQLARYNYDYESKFGYIFIVCATEKSANEMLALIKARIGNQADEELQIAAAEQAKILSIRIRNLIDDDQKDIT